jgi:NADH-quinone oxidoreductase subunit G
MTRCIQCTRCVRFAEESPGSRSSGRSGAARIWRSPPTWKARSPRSSPATSFDLCPVGALVSKPYSFEARVGAAQGAGIDVMDAVGTNIRIDHRFREVMRALPAPQRGRQRGVGARQDPPRGRRPGPPPPRPARGSAATASSSRRPGRGVRAIAARLQGRAGEQVAAIAGDLQDVESVFALKALLRATAPPCTNAGRTAPSSTFEPRRLPLQPDHRRASRKRRPSCSSAPTRAGKRASSTPASARR